MKLFWPYILLSALLLNLLESNGQCVFNKLFGIGNYYYDAGFSVTQTYDGGYIAVGVTFENFDGTYIVRTDECGDTLWTRLYDFCYFAGDEGTSIIQLQDGTFSICGWAVDNSDSVADTYLLKLNDFGDTIWYKNLDQPFRDKGQIHKQTVNGGFIIGGYNYDSTNTISQVFLIKTDNLGEVEWQQEYGEANYNDNIKSIDLTPDGGYIIGGDFENPATGGWDMFLLKTDSLGNEQWKEYYGDAYSDRKGYAIATSDGGYAIVGYKTGATGEVEGYVVKTDSMGGVQWEKTYGIPGYIDLFHQIRQLADNSFIVGGSKRDLSGNPTGVMAWLLKLNQQGDTLWTKAFNYYGGSKHTYMEDLNLTSDGGFIATGYIINNAMPAKNDLWLLKTDSLGNTCTIDTITWEGCEFFDCQFFQAGFNILEDTVFLTEGAVAEFTDSSAYATSWSWDFGDSTTDNVQNAVHSYSDTGIYAVMLVAENDYCSDTTWGEVTVLLNTGIQPVGSRSANGVVVYPNPSSDKVTFHINNSEYPVTVTIRDMMGKQYGSYQLHEATNTISLEKMEPGIYLYSIETGGNRCLGKIVVY